ncbi:MAG: hypothetical protein P4L73_18840 [Caulobacteraceae bacterium]|nr:hypothetical protein [Caulobacteraceae bacterium]
MSDRLFLALMAAAAAAMIGFAAIWPQGLGARSPWPIGHTPVQQTPAMQAAMAREAAKAQKKYKVRTDAAAAQLRRVMTPTPGAASSAPPASAAPPAAPAKSAGPKAAGSKSAVGAGLRTGE